MSAELEKLQAKVDNYISHCKSSDGIIGPFLEKSENTTKPDDQFCNKSLRLIQTTICHGRSRYPNGSVTIWISLENGKMNSSRKKLKTCS